MLGSLRKLSGRVQEGVFQGLVFFVLFYLYLWLVVETHLIYHGAGMFANFPAFFRDWTFLAGFMSYPGGPVECFSALLAQFFYYSWAGALVVTLQAGLICICVDYFLKAVGAARLRWLSFIPPILLLIFYNQYTYHFTTTMALLTVLLFVCLYLKVTPKNKLYALAVFLVLSIVLYYISGGAYLVFAAVCAIYELFWTNRRQMGFVYLLSAVAVPYIQGVLVFDAVVVDAFGESWPFSWGTSHYERRRIILVVLYALYLFMPLVAIGLGFWSLFSKNRIKKAPHAKSPKVGTGLFSWLIKPKFLIIAAVLAVCFSANAERKALFETDYYTCYGDWSQTLASAQQHPNSYFVINDVDRALYHTGRLGYDMCSYPQLPEVLFVTSPKHDRPHWQRFDVYLELGLINMAEGELIEALEMFGERPLILKRLALVNMVKANLGAAEIYLRALSKTFFDADWADSYLNKIESDPNLLTDERIQSLRKLMLKKDLGGAVSLGIDRVLLILLETNKQNRMAFEYLMSWYMLSVQLDKFVQNLHRLDDFDYQQIPTLYEEAILLYTFVTKKQVDLRGRQISLQTRRRFDDSSRILARYRQDKRAAFRELVKNYGNSYFFYYLYRRSGMKK